MTTSMSTPSCPPYALSTRSKTLCSSCPRRPRIMSSSSTWTPSRKLVSTPAIHLVHTRSSRSEEHTSELQSRGHLVCRLLLEKKKKTAKTRKRHARQDDDLRRSS